MVSRGDDTVVLWPRYFDAKASRKEGRRVPASLAVSKPDAKWIESAAKKAGLEPVLQEDACHPCRPHKAMGRVLVPKDRPKEAILKAVAEQMGTS